MKYAFRFTEILNIYSLQSSSRKIKQFYLLGSSVDRTTTIRTGGEKSGEKMRNCEHCGQLVSGQNEVGVCAVYLVAAPFQLLLSSSIHNVRTKDLRFWTSCWQALEPTPEVWHSAYGRRRHEFDMTNEWQRSHRLSQRTTQRKVFSASARAGRARGKFVPPSDQKTSYLRSTNLKI